MGAPIRSAASSETAYALRAGEAKEKPSVTGIAAQKQAQIQAAQNLTAKYSLDLAPTGFSASRFCMPTQIPPKPVAAPAMSIFP